MTRIHTGTGPVMVADPWCGRAASRWIGRIAIAFGGMGLIVLAAISRA